MTAPSWSRLLLVMSVFLLVPACRLRRPRTPPGGPESPGGALAPSPRHAAPDAAGALQPLDAGIAKPKAAD